MVNKQFSALGRVSKLAVVKSFLQLHMLVDFDYFFLANLLNLKFCIHVINIEMISQKNIHGK